MKINNILIKIQAKIKLLAGKIFGRPSRGKVLLTSIMAIFISLNYYYYIADRGIYSPLALLGSAFITFLLLTIAFGILDKLILILSRMDRKNLIMFLSLYYIFYKLLEDLAEDAFLDDLYIYLFALVADLILIIFVKSLLGLFRNKKKLSILFLIPSGALIAFAVFFLITAGDNEELKNLKIDNSDKISMDSKINFSSGSLDYELDKSVSLLSYVNYSGRTKKVRDFYFKRGLNKVPLRGRIWYPKGEENSPVVFMIHGNHRFTTENYLGYDYLGKYLARRGIAFVSVDENMLNGFSKFGLGNENDARAILLLENIKALLEESSNKNSQYYKLFDKDNIVLAGHSRGGEAVAIAGVLNKLKLNPDTGKEMNYNFNIKGIVSIAPTVDQYNPSGKDIKLKDINFLTVHGSHDKDVQGFSGMKIYDNTELTSPDKFKAAIYMGFANHGQFNELWGKWDSDPPESFFINTSALMAEEDQEEALSKILYAFLEDSFNIRNSRDFFKDTDKYALPDTVYFTRYSDGSFVPLVDYEDDFDLLTFNYGSCSYQGFNKVKEDTVNIGSKELYNTALHLSYYNEADYELVFDDFLPTKDYLQFDLMVKNENFDNIDMDVELRDSYGIASRVKLSDYKTLKAPVKVEHSKLQKFTDEYDYKSSFETIRIPLEDFGKEINKSEIKYLDFIFKSGNNKVVIDNIGYSD